MGEPGWLDPYVEEYEHDPDYIAEGLALDIVEEACGLMEQQNISRSQLAERMGVNRAQVTMMFNCPPNMTLRSVARLALALGVKPVLTFVPRKKPHGK